MEETVNQRFRKFLYVLNMKQNSFSETTGISEKNVSNIVKDKVESPTAPFFEAIARHFPEWLFWLLTGEDRYYPGEGSEAIQYMRAPQAEQRHGQKHEMEQLLRIVEQQSKTIEQLSKLVNLREEVERLKTAMKEQDKG